VISLSGNTITVSKTIGLIALAENLRGIGEHFASPNHQSISIQVTADRDNGTALIRIEKELSVEGQRYAKRGWSTDSAFEEHHIPRPHE